MSNRPTEPKKHGKLLAVVVFEDRDDGGLRVSSPTHPGLILSGADRKAVAAEVLTALDMLEDYKTARGEKP